MQSRFEIRNESIDIVSSQMMERLGMLIERHIPGVQDVMILSEPIPDTKGVVVTVLIGIISGVLSTALWDLIKKVYSSIRHSKGYVWKITVFADKPIFISIQDGVTGADICISERSDFEDRKMR